MKGILIFSLASILAWDLHAAGSAMGGNSSMGGSQYQSTYGGYNQMDTYQSPYHQSQGSYGTYNQNPYDGQSQDAYNQNPSSYYQTQTPASSYNQSPYYQSSDSYVPQQDSYMQNQPWLNRSQDTYQQGSRAQDSYGQTRSYTSPRNLQDY